MKAWRSPVKIKFFIDKIYITGAQKTSEFYDNITKKIIVIFKNLSLKYDSYVNFYRQNQKGWFDVFLWNILHKFHIINISSMVNKKSENRLYWMKNNHQGHNEKTAGNQSVFDFYWQLFRNHLIAANIVYTFSREFQHWFFVLSDWIFRVRELSYIKHYWAGDFNSWVA